MWYYDREILRSGEKKKRKKKHSKRKTHTYINIYTWKKGKNERKKIDREIKKRRTTQSNEFDSKNEKKGNTKYIQWEEKSRHIPISCGNILAKEEKINIEEYIKGHYLYDGMKERKWEMEIKRVKAKKANNNNKKMERKHQILKTLNEIELYSKHIRIYIFATDSIMNTLFIVAFHTLN